MSFISSQLLVAFPRVPQLDLSVISRFLPSEESVRSVLHWALALLQGADSVHSPSSLRSISPPPTPTFSLRPTPTTAIPTPTDAYAGFAVFLFAACVALTIVGTLARRSSYQAGVYGKLHLRESRSWYSIGASILHLSLVSAIVSSLPPGASLYPPAPRFSVTVVAVPFGHDVLCHRFSDTYVDCYLVPDTRRLAACYALTLLVFIYLGVLVRQCIIFQTKWRDKIYVSHSPLIAVPNTRPISGVDIDRETLPSHRSNPEPHSSAISTSRSAEVVSAFDSPYLRLGLDSNEDDTDVLDDLEQLRRDLEQMVEDRRRGTWTTFDSRVLPVPDTAHSDMSSRAATGIVVRDIRLICAAVNTVQSVSTHRDTLLSRRSNPEPHSASISTSRSLDLLSAFDSRYLELGLDTHEEDTDVLDDLDQLRRDLALMVEERRLERLAIFDTRVPDTASSYTSGLDVVPFSSSSSGILAISDSVQFAIDVAEAAAQDEVGKLEKMLKKILVRNIGISNRIGSTLRSSTEDYTY